VPDATLGTRPVAEGLLTGLGADARLLGSRCRVCENVTFPQARSCPRCTSQDMEQHVLGRKGTLWSWTIQGFAPKSPPYAGSAEDFVPYGVGYIELDGEVRVEARLTESDPERLSIGMPMSLTLITVPGSPEAVTYAFAPADDGGGSR
jgi:uncharacterized OB-fold protein